MKTLSLALLALVACWSSGASFASAANKRSALSAEQNRLAAELLVTLRLYDCCDDTIAACLLKKPVCPLALRLEQAVYRMILQGMKREEIALSLEKRKQSMLSAGSPAQILLDDRFRAGEPNAPVVLAIYACGRSPHCAKLAPSLYREISAGSLKGKVRLYCRPFFPTGQDDAAACGRALVAAADQSMFWPFVLYLYDNQESFKLCMMGRYAEMKGLDRDAFELASAHPRTLEFLAASRLEAAQNKVTKVPTAFINGRKIELELTVETLLDLLGEESERSAR